MLEGFLISIIGGGMLSVLMSVYLTLKIKNTKMKNIKKIHDIIQDSKRSYRKGHRIVACKRIIKIKRYLK